MTEYSVTLMAARFEWYGIGNGESFADGCDFCFILFLPFIDQCFNSNVPK